MSAAVAVMPLAVALASLERAIGAVRAAAATADTDQACAIARAADSLNAIATSVLPDAEHDVMNGARLMHRDARALAATRDVLAHMPRTAGLLARGVISFSQARAIATEVRPLRSSDRVAVDDLVASRARMLERAEPEALVFQVECEVARLRSTERARAERRAEDAEFLWVQRDLSGGGRLFAQAGPDALATILEAVDAQAARAVNADDPAAPSRGAQRLAGLVAACERSLAGGDGVGRARPRVYVTADARDLADLGASEAARLMWNLPGRPAALSPTLARLLACDAEVVPILFDGAQPLSVGDARKTVPDKVRTAVLIRDGGCRFPGCGAPVAWCDVHHTVPGVHDPTLLVSLCRRCHRRVHSERYRIRTRPDGTIEFRRRGVVTTSAPRARPLRA